MIEKNKIDQNLVDENLIEKEEDISLKDYDLKKKRLAEKRKKKLINIMVSLIISFLIVFLGIYGIYLFFNTRLTGQQLEGWRKQLVNEIGYLLKKSGFLGEGGSVDFDLTKINEKNKKLEMNKFKNYLNNTSIGFLTKKEEIKNQVTNVIDSMKKDQSDINTLKDKIVKYAYLPKQIDELIDGGNINDILISVEGIKIMAAMRLYFYLDSFLNSLSDKIGRSVSFIRRKMYYYNKRGEKNIKDFLIMCYLNPFETDRKECNYINDFDFYYKNVLGLKDFDTDFYKNLISFIIDRLNDTNYNNLEIIFNSLDPKKRTISFTVNINTFKEDEESITKNLLNYSQFLSDIYINPHIFVAVTFINLLRESHFILGDKIKLDSLKVTTRKKKDIIVHSSSFSFSVKIQPEFVREIYDY